MAPSLCPVISHWTAHGLTGTDTPHYFSHRGGHHQHTSPDSYLPAAPTCSPAPFQGNSLEELSLLCCQLLLRELPAGLSPPPLQRTHAAGAHVLCAADTNGHGAWAQRPRPTCPISPSRSLASLGLQGGSPSWSPLAPSPSAGTLTQTTAP